MKDKIILLVEDNPYDETLTREAFKVNRFENPIFVARDGEEAQEYLFTAHGYFDLNTQDILVLLDLKLPKVSGLEVLKEIRATPRTALIPVVVLTSSTEKKDIFECYQLTANSYIRKPVDFSEFVVVVKDLANYWLRLNQFPPKGLNLSP